MSYHAELLELCETSVSELDAESNQASLRRAVSTAYYAVFHLFTSEGSRLLLGDAIRLRPLRTTVRRAFSHQEMRAAAAGFASGSVSEKLGAALADVPIPLALAGVARAFIDLQSERHRADYELTTDFEPEHARFAVESAQRVFADWASIRDTEPARVFLVALLLLRSIRQ